MLTESLKKKINFVKDLNAATVKVQRNVVKVSYEVYEHASYGTQEYLVVEYNGGAFSARNCNGNSCSAVFEELSKLLEHGYYDEVEDWADIAGSDQWELLNNFL